MPSSPFEREPGSVGSASAARLSELFGAVLEPHPLSGAELARVHGRLLSRKRSARSRRLREATLAGVMLLAGASVAFAGLGVSNWLLEQRPHAGARTPQLSLPPTARSGPRVTAKAQLPPRASSAEPPATDVVRPNSSPLVTSSTPAPAFSSERAPITSSAPQVSTLGAQSAALERVLLKLRRDRDPSGALALLDASQPLFTQGALEPEAQVARVDALLLLKREPEALAILDQMPLNQSSRGGELRLVRAELRAKTDCARASADFDELARMPLVATLSERALYGSAVCALKLHDRARAEQDLNEYLRRFPQGRFADHARRELALPPAIPEPTH